MTMSYAIVFSSKTGNTRLLADTLRASLEDPFQDPSLTFKPG